MKVRWERWRGTSSGKIETYGDKADERSRVQQWDKCSRSVVWLPNSKGVLYCARAREHRLRLWFVCFFSNLVIVWLRSSSGERRTHREVISSSMACVTFSFYSLSVCWRYIAYTVEVSVYSMHSNMRLEYDKTHTVYYFVFDPCEMGFCGGVGHSWRKPKHRVRIYERACTTVTKYKRFVSEERDLLHQNTIAVSSIDDTEPQVKLKSIWSECLVPLIYALSFNACCTLALM